MRTTLSIDDDVLATAKAHAEAEHKTLGEVVSRTLRTAFAPPPRAEERVFKNGLLLLPRSERKHPVTLELINQLRDDEE